MSEQTVSFQIIPSRWRRLNGVVGLLPSLVCSCSRLYCIVLLPGIAGVIDLAFGVFCGCLNWSLACMSIPPPVSVNGFIMLPEDFDYSGAFGLA